MAEGKCVSQLLSGLFRRWVGGDIEVQYAPAIMRQHQKHVEDLETKGVYREEVDRDQSLIRNAGFAIFISGNREDAGKSVIASGVVSEFEIAHNLGVTPIPVGATGWAAEQIWKEAITKSTTLFRADVTAQLNVLGEPGHSDDEYVEAIFGIINDVQR